ncbi:MAG: acyl carrier protein [Gammaproteobacteria bacterium]|nr:acyl carrier protein [Gammaproteobacteria bacterium]
MSKRLKQMLIEELGYSRNMDSINSDRGLHGTGLGLDFVDVVSLMVKLEQEFDIFFEAEDVTASIKNFGSLVEAIQRKLPEKKG